MGMTQQFLSGGANDYYKKRLFIDLGFEYKEVKAKIIEPYTPPEPQINLKEQKIISAPSHLHQQGFASYKAKLRLLFYDRASYSEYLAYAENTHKFYDEKGVIFLGSVESMNRAVYEASKKYIVEISLILIKKDAYDKKHRHEFLDLVEVQTGEPVQYAQDVVEMSDLGLIATHYPDGSPVLYFNGDNIASRAEFAAFLNRTRRWTEYKIRE